MHTSQLRYKAFKVDIIMTDTEYISEGACKLSKD
jgi:hypothetical protein